MKAKKFNILFAFIFCQIAALCADEEDSSQREESSQPAGIMRAINEDEVKQYPHNAVLSLEVHYSNPRQHAGPVRQCGTGFAISDRLVLTAAHVVFNPQFGLPSKIICYKNRHGNLSVKPPMPEPQVLVHKYAYLSAYEDMATIQGADTERLISQACFDYALLYLKESTGLAEFIKHCKGDELEMWFCGYPGEEYNNIWGKDRDHAKATYPYEIAAHFEGFYSCKKHKGEGRNDLECVMTFKTLSYKGMSGSPVRFRIDEIQDAEEGNFQTQERWHANSILSKGNSQCTVSCHLTSEKIGIINRWQEVLPGLKQSQTTNFEVLGVIEEKQEEKGLLDTLLDYFGLNDDE